MLKNIYFSLALLLSCLGFVAQPVLAASANAPSTPTNTPPITAVQPFQLQPRLSLWGFTGDRTFATGQFLAPLYGDQTKSLYVITEGNIVNNDGSWLAGAGLGYRQVVSSRIYGGYILADYASTPHNGFTIISPGLEMLGEVWDININGYIPLDNKKKLGKAGWAGDDFGQYQYGYATGHSYYDHRLQQYEEPVRGFDFEVGRVIPHFTDAKLSLGAYHFDSKDAGSTNGVKAKLTYELNKYVGLELRDYYDNTKHNTFMAGVRFTLGGHSKEEKKNFGIAGRLSDTLARDAMMLTMGGTMGQGVKVSTVDLGQRLEYNNIWYFKPQPSSTAPKNGNVQDIGPQQGSGTAEDPFVGFTPDNVNVIPVSQAPLMYFAPGSYNFNGFSSRLVDNRFNLPNGWGMYGRTSDYLSPTMGDARATFFGGLDLYYNEGQGTAATTLNSIRIINNVDTSVSNAVADKYSTTMYATNADNIILQNTQIENNVKVSLQSARVNAYSYGIYVYNSTLNFTQLNDVDGSQNDVKGWASVSGDDPASTSYGYGYGIYAADHAVINFNGGINNISGIGTGIVDIINPPPTQGGFVTACGNGYGIYANYYTVINFNGGTNNINGDAFGHGYFNSAQNNLHTYTSTGESNGDGIYADHSSINFSGGTNTVTGTGSGYGVNYTAGSTGRGYGHGNGIHASDTTINITDGTNTISGNGYGTGIDTGENQNFSGIGYGEGIGINAYLSTVNVNGGINKVTGTGFGYGINLGNTGTGYGDGNGSGIYANTSDINFIKGTNIISGAGEGHGVGAGNNGIGRGVGSGSGISANSHANINFSGGTNDISGTGNGDGNKSGAGGYKGEGYGYGYGIYVDFATVNFTGGINTLSGYGNGDAALRDRNEDIGNGYGKGYGIYANGATTINFSNGTNTIFGSGNGIGSTGGSQGTGRGEGNGYGVYAVYQDSFTPTINFSNLSPSQITIDVVSNASGDIAITTQYGIYAGNYALLKDKNNADITNNTISQYVTFATGKPNGPTSAAVQWDDHFTLDW